MYSNWVNIGLEKFWKMKAKKMELTDFLALYFDLMIVKNRTLEKQFRKMICKKESDLFELYACLKK
ncbi:MAG: hypothetical protein EAZ44_05225 [Cytophagia bacterium]|nr:MAG: hypothetical protein EAZ44_05225 [Cytophagia bacterium]TAG43010.1 MAG: hypothetical protein EAZ31_05100 [Cytophagia bacterium]